LFAFGFLFLVTPVLAAGDFFQRIEIIAAIFCFIEFVGGDSARTGCKAEGAPARRRKQEERENHLCKFSHGKSLSVVEIQVAETRKTPSDGRPPAQGARQERNPKQDEKHEE